MEAQTKPQIMDEIDQRFPVLTYGVIGQNDNLYAATMNGKSFRKWMSDIRNLWLAYFITRLYKE